MFQDLLLTPEGSRLLLRNRPGQFTVHDAVELSIGGGEQGNSSKLLIERPRERVGRRGAEDNEADSHRLPPDYDLLDYKRPASDPDSTETFSKRQKVLVGPCVNYWFVGSPPWGLPACLEGFLQAYISDEKVFEPNQAKLNATRAPQKRPRLRMLVPR